MKINKIFIGYDKREDIACKVCEYSIKKFSNINTEFLDQDELRECNIYYRDIDNKGSTSFTFTRFLVPHLSNFINWSIFVDGDFIFTENVKNLQFEVDGSKAVYVVKHIHIPKNNIKMDNQKQYIYPRKNWSSFILFNNSHPKVKLLTKEVVNNSTGEFLHQFKWLDDDEIGELNIKWNFLVNYYEKPFEIPSAIHYTEGGPYFKNYTKCDFGDIWLLNYKEMTGKTFKKEDILDD